MATPNPVVLSWTHALTCSVEQAWRVCSDTDRFNRAVGLDFAFEETLSADGSMVRRGSTRRLGVLLHWEERPFEFRALQAFKQERVFDNGVMNKSVVSCQLTPAEQGCTLIFRVEFHPRNALTRALVVAEARLRTGPALKRALDDMAALLCGRPNTYDRAAPTLESSKTQALEVGLRQIEPPELARRLEDRIRSGTVVEQRRIRPLQEAEFLDLDEDLVICGFLMAVRSGVLELTWELLCPSCLGPKEGLSQLDLSPNKVHCPSCNIYYDGSFPDSVDVVFRPARALREVNTSVACLLSPARTPHVLAQTPVQASAEGQFSIHLDPGGYRLDTDPGLGGASLEVREGVRCDRITVDLTSTGIHPPVLRVRPGPVRIVFRNRRDQPLHLQLKRCVRPPYTLTAGRLFEFPESTDLLPPEAVAPGLTVEVRTGWVVAVQQVQLELGATADWDLDASAEGNGTCIRVFDDLAQALACVEPLDDDLTVSVGIAQGPIALLAQGDDSMPSGRAVDRALDVMRGVGGGHIGVSEDSRELLETHAGIELRAGVPDWYALVRFHSASERRVARFQGGKSTEQALPTRIGSYTIHGELGRGAMGRVLDAAGPDGLIVVVKLLLPQFARDPDHVQRFYNEAHITQHLDHPNIVTVHDYGTADEGEVFLVMERLEGDELEAQLRRGVLDPLRACAVGIGVLDALQAAHDAGVVHRDIKPANIFIVQDGTVKVIDFGIAHPIEEVDELAQRGIVLGSPRYMAPEQVALTKLDGRADLYSTALVLYECITGDIPFSGADALTLARARLSAPPAPLHERSAHPLPLGLEGVIMKALHRDPPLRYFSAAEMSRALADIHS